MYHYVARHGVRPGDAFVAHACCNLGHLQCMQEGGMLQWDEATGTAAPLPRGTAEFVRDWSTLGFRLKTASDAATGAPQSSCSLS
ncbi:hypothetical protein JKP88DRAFT_239798 [Tribonema minus]|uniref:Uncharacterized protein n=1 Tax=Tribonema minus TaxID=303371 RepID=A0A835YT98_9STRA|nr:hypothetical protein JKP88DRAFT_224729 [Tribonema minus]KAG5180659.1 hypothetical protein JKP88DRAFT_239798 [Tribonema minus]